MADERFQDFPEKTTPSGSDELVGVDNTGYLRVKIDAINEAAPEFTASEKGVVPASGGSTGTRYLNDQGGFTVPAGGGGSSSSTFFDTYLAANNNIALVAFGDSNMNGVLQGTATPQF